MVDDTMLQVPTQASSISPPTREIWLEPVGTISNALNHFYVNRPSTMQSVTVDGTADDGGFVQLQLNTLNGASS